MNFIFVIFIFFVGGGYLLGKILGNIMFPKSKDDVFSSKDKESSVIINNYITENHLHITEKQLKEINK